MKQKGYKLIIACLLILGVAMLPQHITAGTNVWTQGNGMCGGNIYSLASDGSTLYAGTDNGVYKSTDNGGNWTLVNSDIESQRVYALAVEGDNIFAGTESGGVFKSVDGGNSWSPENGGDLSPVPAGIFSLTIHSGDGVIYAAASTGIYQSSISSPLSWSQKNGDLPSAPPPYALAVAIDPGDSSHIFAGFLFMQGVYESVNGGEYWTQVLSSKIGLSLFVDDTYVYAGANDGVYRRNMGVAGSLTPHHNLGLEVYALAVNADDVYSGTREGVYLNIDKDWPATSKITSFVLEGTTVYASTEGIGVFIKTETSEWTRKSNGLPPLKVYHLATSSSAMYAGTEGGIFKSIDQGVNWMELCGSCLQYNKVYSLVVYPDGTIIYAGLNNGGVKSIDGGCNWEEKFIPDGDFKVTALVLSGDDIYAGLSNGEIHKSADGGYNWTEITDPSPGSEYIHELAVKTDDPDTLYAADKKGVFKMTGGGATIENKKLNEEANSAYTALALDFGNPSHIYAGAEGVPLQGIFKSNDSGDIWSTLDDSMQVDSLLYDSASSTLYVGTRTDGVYRSGSSFDQFNDGMPSPIRINSLALDPTDSDIIHAGTSVGPYVYTIEPECTIDADCNDGLFCNGVESCAGGFCQTGTNPCGSGQSCNESQYCYTPPQPGDQCNTDADCNDSNPCTDDSCEGGSCSYTDNDDPCDNGLFCTVDDTCVDGECVGTEKDCDDDLFCTGTESCNEDKDQCESSGDPCEAGEICNDEDDICMEPPIPCEISINPASLAVVSEQSVSFNIEDSGDCEDTNYEWSVESTIIDSSIDQDGNYIAGVNTDCSEEATDLIRVDDTANGISATATVSVSCDRILGVINISNPLWILDPSAIYSSHLLPLTNILVILAEQGNFDETSSLSFEPAGNINTLCSIGVGDFMISLVIVETNAQEGSYRGTVTTGSHMVTQKEALIMSMLPWILDE